MNEKFSEVRKDLLSTLAKYRLDPLPPDEYKRLREKYGYGDLISAVTYFIGEGMIPSDARNSDFSGAFLIPSNLRLTSRGFNYATNDAIGNEINSITVKLHSNTLQQLESIINASNLTEENKKTLLMKLKKKGGEYFITKCIDLGFSNVTIASQMFLEYLKNM